MNVEHTEKLAPTQEQLVKQLSDNEAEQYTEFDAIVQEDADVDGEEVLKS